MTTGSGSSGFRSSAPTALGQPDTAGPEHRTGGPAAGRPPIRCGWPGKSLSRRGRGCPTGIRVREQQRSFRTSVPSCSVRRLVCGERCGLGVPGERRRSSLNFTRTKGRGRRRARVRIRSADQSSACLQSLLTPPRQDGPAPPAAVHSEALGDWHAGSSRSIAETDTADGRGSERTGSRKERQKK